MDAIFYSYSGYLIIALIAIYFAGYLLLAVTGLIPDKKYLAIFFSLVAGLTVVVVGTALAACKFNSVLIGIPVLAAVLFFRLRKNGLIPTAKPRVAFKIHLFSLLELSIVALLVFGFRYWFGYAVFGQPSLHPDLIFYGKLSDYILNTGIETSNIEYIYPEDNTVLPYHYYELWLNAAFLKVFNAVSANLLYLVTYTLGILAVWAGFCAIFETRTRITFPIKLICLTCLFLAGVDFPDFRNRIFEYTVYLQFNVLFYTKLFPVFLGLISSLLFYLHKQERAAYLSLLFLPIISIVTAPAILGGLSFFTVYLLSQGKKKEAIELGFLMLAVALFFEVFYSFTVIKRHEKD